ncbi:hypothetical protein QYF61_020234 [Mycteria americana]|uniref:Uncharacterized protein n=1 Tax=Mycteria americana TaxID=33587 RepID=A0AAN7NV00_MYCAM|nr:hypothetical protein QYF61_020234 [Mycteria americana]
MKKIWVKKRFQKTGHSRRFGRFTHGALSYQDPAPPHCPECAGMGSGPTAMPQGAASRGWAGMGCSSPAPKQGPGQLGAPGAPHEAKLLLAPQLWFLGGCQAVVAGLESLVRWQRTGQLAVCQAAEGQLGVEGSSVAPHRAVAVQWRGAMVGQETCSVPQGSVGAACEGSGSDGEKRLALPGCTALAFLGQDVRVALIRSGCILPVGRLSLMLYPEHPCFINQGHAMGHGHIKQHLQPVG